MIFNDFFKKNSRFFKKYAIIFWESVEKKLDRN